MKKIRCIILTLTLALAAAMPVLALTEEEAAAAVEAQGREAVSGNLFLWFLCAIAFLKVSTKLDGILQALGIGVGRSPGSLLTEALLALRGLDMGKAALGLGARFGHGKGGLGGGAAAAPAGGVLAGGLAGVVGRNIQQATAGAMSGAAPQGVGAGIGAGMYRGSLGEQDGFASHVIGSVATGATPGAITGDAATEAMGGYFAAEGAGAGAVDADSGDFSVNIPTGTDAAESPDSADLAAAGYSLESMSGPALGAEGDFTNEPIPTTPLAMEGGSAVPVSMTDAQEAAAAATGSPYPGDIPASAEGGAASGGTASGSAAAPATIPTSPSMQAAALQRVMRGQMGNQTTGVEIGGGKITGREIIPGQGQIQFAMYNAKQFERPSGQYSTHTSLDGEKWYKVYATTAVERRPTQPDEYGKMQYDERKIAALPKAPNRRR